MSGFTQLRIELPDHPGALAAVTRVLAQHGTNVVEVSIHEVDGGVRVPRASRSPKCVTTGVAVLTGIAPIHVMTPAEALEYPIGAAALRRGAPVVQRLDRVPDVLRSDGGEGGRWVLAAPDGPEAQLVVLAARPYVIRFTATEVRRLVAVLDCRRRLRAVVHPEQDERATWSRALASNA